MTRRCAGSTPAMAGALDGHPKPLSWQRLLGGGLSDMAGKYRFVLAAAAAGLRRAATRRRGHDGAAQDHRRAAVRPRRRGAGAHHRPGRAGGRGIRHRRPGRGRRADRQRAADHAVAVPRGAHLAADRADPADARAWPDADAVVRQRRGRHAEPGVGRLRHPVRRHRGGFRHPVLGALPRARASSSPIPRRRCARPRRAPGPRSWSPRWQPHRVSSPSCRPISPAWPSWERSPASAC